MCLDVLTGVDEVKEASSLKIFPNPAISECRVGLTGVNVNGIGYRLEMFNALSEKVKSTSIPIEAKFTNLDVSDVPKGLYLFVVDKGGGSN